MNKLLAKAREVNDVWLIGWGCRLRRFGAFRVLENSQLRDYNTIYDVAEPEYVRSATEWAQRIGAVLYLPQEVRFAEARRQTTAADWRSVFRTETVVARLSEAAIPAERRVSLKAADEGSLNRWTDLYRENYGFPDNLLEANRERWALAFRSEPAIRFYFATVDGEPAGTAQLVLLKNGFCGIYSLAMPIERRGLPILYALAVKLIGESMRLGATWICYVTRGYGALRKSQGHCGGSARHYDGAA
ncbi:MAG: hypothetical protein ACLQU1_35085 [Bryobacteraceae bacterium]